MSLPINKKISKYYTKYQAESYESQRNNPIWLLEIETFNKIKKRFVAKFNRQIDILDIPVGTGRWIPHLHNIASKYVGVDASQYMLDQAVLKLENCPDEFKENVELINSSIINLPLHNSKTFDLIISTRFLPHFSISEIKNIMSVLRTYSKTDLLVMTRVTDKRSSILFEIFNLIIKSPLRAIRRYLKSGRLSYIKLDSDYNNIFNETGFHVVKKNLVFEDRHSRFEYWELTLNNEAKVNKK